MFTLNNTVSNETIELFQCHEICVTLMSVSIHDFIVELGN
jgi:hypothetical protein